MLGMIEALQILVFLPLLSTTMPANVGSFMGFLMTIAAFDFFDTAEGVEYVFSLEPSEAPSDENLNFDVLGMGSLYFISNLGTAIFIFLYQVLLTLTYFILNPFRHSCGKWMNQKVK